MKILKNCIMRKGKEFSEISVKFYHLDFFKEIYPEHSLIQVYRKMVFFSRFSNFETLDMPLGGLDKPFYP